jgi:uncharacterized protein YxjI
MIFCRKCGRYYPDQTPSCIVCKADLATFGHVTHQGASMQAEPARAAVKSAPVAALVKAAPVAATVRTTAVGAAVKMAPVPDTAVGVLEPDSDSNTDPVFDRDKFLLRQKALAIKEKYYVTDDQGNALMFVERPALLTQQIFMLGAVASTFFGGSILMAYVANLIGTSLGEGFRQIFPLVALVAVMAATVFVFVLLVPKRHVTFYKDDSKTEKILEIRQLNKIEFPYANFSILDRAGNLIGSLRKNMLFDFIRRRWQVKDANGQELCMAKEDSIILSLLRRTGIWIFLLMRTNFVFLRGKDVIGEFIRKFTLLDRYVLDLTADRQRVLDRRIALALGVMLDTGERR